MNDNMHKYQNIALWLIAIVITVSSAVYQKTTGPTYPIKGEVQINDTTISYKLLRSHNTGIDARIIIPVDNETITGTYDFRRFRSNDDWTTSVMEENDGSLVATLPHQPPAGKIMYRLYLIDADGIRHELHHEPVLIRFKGAVPAYILIPHIFFMFFAMLISNRSGLQALVRGESLYKYALWTAGLLLAGGLILGPVVQKFAFGAFWTGWPWGHDLTDNKTIVAFLAWGLAIWKNRGNRHNPGWVLAASIILFMVYMIPHSVLGSELDFTSMEQ